MYIAQTSYYELKWILLGEWLGQGFGMYDQTYDYTGPLSAWVYKGLYSLFGRSQWVFYIFSSILITIQAGIFNALLLRNKVYNENSYLPAFLYMITAVSVPDFMTLSPHLMSLTFVLLALRNVIRRINNQVTDELFLSNGIYVGIASMLYLPSSVFFLVFLFSFILFSSAVPRRLVLYLFGFLLIFGLCGIYFYVQDSFSLFMERAIFSGMALPAKVTYSWGKLALLAAPFAFILILSLVKKSGSIRLTNFQQKVEQVLWILFLGGLATFFLSNERSGFEFLFFVPVVAYFWTHYFVLLKRRVFIATMPAVLIFGLLIFTGYSYQNLKNPTATDIEISKKNLLVIGERLEEYADQQILTPFFHHQLSRDFIYELDTYEGAENFREIFEKIQPIYILDDMDVMHKVGYRFPYISKGYQMRDKSEYQKINN